MILIGWMLLAAAVWYGLRGSAGTSMILVVACVGAVVLIRWKREAIRMPSNFMRKTLAGCQILALFGWELVLSNLQQLRVVLGPSRLVQPHWLSFRTELRSPALRAVFGLLISLTPGSMTVDIDEDGTVWVHVLVAEDDEEVIRRLREVLERPLRRLES